VGKYVKKIALLLLPWYNKARDLKKGGGSAMTAQMRPGEVFQQFQKEAQELWEEIDRWMEEHPEATLKEIERYLRPLRRKFLARIVALQLLKRGAGVSLEAPRCSHCGRPMEYKGIRDRPTVGLELEGDLPEAYYYCPHCGEGFSPLRQRLGLGRGPWSELLMEEGCRMVAESPSYANAEEKIYRLTGASISDTTLWRLFGEVSEALLATLEGEEAVCAALPEGEEEPGGERVEEFDPLVGERACLSVDGTTVLTREEGWKEVKGVTISAIEERAGEDGEAQTKAGERAGEDGEAQTKAGERAGEDGEAQTKAGERVEEPKVYLTRHSYRMRMADKYLDPVCRSGTAASPVCPGPGQHKRWFAVVLAGQWGESAGSGRDTGLGTRDGPSVGCSPGGLWGREHGGRGVVQGSRSGPMGWRRGNPLRGEVAEATPTTEATGENYPQWAGILSATRCATKCFGNKDIQ